MNMELIAHKINHINPKHIEGDNVYIRRDRIKITNKDKIRLRFNSVNSTLKQAIAVTADKYIKNIFDNEKAKSWAFWYDGDDKYIDLECTTKNGELHIYNGCEDSNGNRIFGRGGLAMKVEDLPDGSRRYHCNDFELDNDFDDFVFTLSFLDGRKVESLLDE